MSNVLHVNFLSGGPIVEMAKPASVTLLKPFGPSKTLDALARDSQTKSVEAREAGDESAYARHLSDMMLFDAEAARARRWESRCAELDLRPKSH